MERGQVQRASHRRITHPSTQNFEIQRNGTVIYSLLFSKQRVNNTPIFIYSQLEIRDLAPNSTGEKLIKLIISNYA